MILPTHFEFIPYLPFPVFRIALQLHWSGVAERIWVFDRVKAIQCPADPSLQSYHISARTAM